MFEQIISVSPDYANARWYLSAMYEEKGKLDQALEQAKKVQEGNKDNQDVAKRITYLEDLIAKQKGEPSKEGTAGPLPSPVEEKIKGPSEQNPIQKP